MNTKTLDMAPSTAPSTEGYALAPAPAPAPSTEGLTDADEATAEALKGVKAETPSRRALVREIQAARLATASKLQAMADKAFRAQAGYSGREGYSQWLSDVSETVRRALDGTTQALVLAPVSTSKAGSRCVATGLVRAAGTAIMLRAECTIRDIADRATLAGAVVMVKLTLQERKRGPVLLGESTGLASTGVRIGLTCRVSALRKPQINAAALMD